MEIRSLMANKEGSWERQHSEFLAFITRFGNKVVSEEASRYLRKLSPKDLTTPGTSLLLAVITSEDGERIAGASCMTSYGCGINLVIVHPLYRGTGIGSKLLMNQISTLGRLSCLVSLNNISSLQMCFRAGLSARGLIKGQGGRPLLLLEDISDLSPIQKVVSPTTFKEGDPVVTTRPGHIDSISK
ncbi:GNAT superfamily N-acetyltransferase [Paenibacillus anaericanus]|uniref:GNAT family N-acetyltransferase n=1 Tax=Paenibacillus anaericanus TaxID=170367 RepID=UPI0027815BD3|nr:GNAT family N-acetyltransferase [Paenibacillus anaericanus]MDQ0087019.1 GNAT superfamily N-acetyltransferase [Paenibacillus anaericanus]